MIDIKKKSKTRRVDQSNQTFKASLFKIKEVMFEYDMH